MHSSVSSQAGPRDACRPVALTSPGQLFVHFLTLNAFAIAQPLLERLSGNVRYLQMEDFAPSVVIAAVFLLLLGLPLLAVAPIMALRRAGAVRAAMWTTRVMILFFSIAGMLVVVRWLSRSLGLLQWGIPDAALGMLAVLSGIAGTGLYFRAGLFRQFLTVAAVGCLMFPLQFFCVPAMRHYLRGTGHFGVSAASRIGNPVPVLMVVFDGLCGMALLDDKYEIDRIRYPGFGRLADISTFYRNTTTVHTRTDHALPAMLTSALPGETAQPVESDYPTSLFRRIFDSGQYDITIFEPVTQLAPRDWQQLSHSRSWHHQLFVLTETLLRVFVNVSLPEDSGLATIQVPRTWFGIRPNNEGRRRSDKGLLVYSFDDGRDVQCAHFADCLTKTERPGFRFLHIVLPHDPFSMLPSGVSTSRRSNITDPLLGEWEEIWSADEWPVLRAWQRYLLQLQYADRWLNEYLSRLETAGLLDQSLIVVTSDHGMAFAPGVSRRTATAATLPDIYSVPLFIKQPGQRQGVVTDVNVETIDILPTIADILQMPTDPRWAGQSLIDSRFQPLPRKTLRGTTDTIVEADFPHRFNYVRRMIAAFGTGAQQDRLQSLNLLPDLLGRPLDDFRIGSRSEFRTVLLVGEQNPDPDFPKFVPCYLHGHLIREPEPASDILERPGRQIIGREIRLAVALNGRILATTRTSADRIGTDHWGALLPEQAYRPSGNRLQIFEITGEGQDVELREVPLEMISG